MHKGMLTITTASRVGNTRLVRSHVSTRFCALRRFLGGAGCHSGFLDGLESEPTRLVAFR